MPQPQVLHRAMPSSQFILERSQGCIHPIVYLCIPWIYSSLDAQVILNILLDLFFCGLQLDFWQLATLCGLYLAGNSTVWPSNHCSYMVAKSYVENGEPV
jgi:hypothetical protein